MLRTDEVYLKSLNVWNIKECDQNKLICTTWNDANCYIVDRNNPYTMKNPIVIVDPDKKNIHPTDLWPLPGYHS